MCRYQIYLIDGAFITVLSQYINCTRETDGLGVSKKKKNNNLDHHV